MTGSAWCGVWNLISVSGVDKMSRERVLSAIGFASYEDYLQSDLWASIRLKVFQLKGRKCCVCRDVATQVHHKCYDAATLTGHSIKSLLPICKSCHDKAHEQGSLAAANRFVRDNGPRERKPARKRQSDDLLALAQIAVDTTLQKPNLTRDQIVSAVLNKWYVSASKSHK